MVVDVDGPLRVITINRPEKKNALHPPAWDALRDALAEAQADPTCGGVVLTGAGDAFCAGVDLTAMADPSVWQGLDLETQGYGGVMGVLEQFDVPLVAAVNGVGVGFGLTILPLCDHVVMADTARLKAPFVDMGVTTEGATSYLMVERIGWPATARLVLTGDWVTADEALAIGLAQQVVPAADVVAVARDIAGRIAAGHVDSLRTTKRLMMAARGDAVAAARRRETAEFARMMGGQRA